MLNENLEKYFYPGEIVCVDESLISFLLYYLQTVHKTKTVSKYSNYIQDRDTQSPSKLIAGKKRIWRKQRLPM